MQHRVNNLVCFISLKASSTDSVLCFSEQACEFTLSQHGPFTAFIPAGQNPFQVGWSRLKNTQTVAWQFLFHVLIIFPVFMCDNFLFVASRCLRMLCFSDACRKIFEQRPECSVQKSPHPRTETLQWSGGERHVDVCRRKDQIQNKKGVYPFIHPSIFPSVCLSICPSIHTLFFISFYNYGNHYVYHSTYHSIYHTISHSILLSIVLS